MAFDKIKKLFIDEEEDTVRGDVPIVPINEDDTRENINSLLQPPKKKIVKVVIKSAEDIRKVVDHARAGDLMIIDMRAFRKEPPKIQAIAERIMGIATSTGATIMRISGCDLHLIMVPNDMDVLKEE
jgi:SepF-like predicted cell division protein (DUF552 family)